MDYNTEKIRYISHEVKNQLSICDLYTEIIQKYCDKNEIADETILSAVKSIKKAVKLAGGALIELKTSYEQKIERCNIKSIIEETKDLLDIYADNVKAKIDYKMYSDCDVMVDRNRFVAILVNLVKNACEAFKDEENKQITILVEKEDCVINIHVINNAKPIENPDEIFNEGCTTKPNGSGLGLYISRKNIEDMSGALRLAKSDKESTDFEIMLKAY